MSDNGINRIKHEKLIRSNYEFEQDIADSFTEEIKEIDEYLEFIFENKKDEMKLKRVIKLENTSLDKNVPHDWYIKGEEKGTLKKDAVGSRYALIPINGGTMGFSISSEDKVSWVEWEITYENIDEMSDSFSITLTPFVIIIKAKVQDREINNHENLSLFTHIFYDKWASKLEEMFIEKKRSKVSKIISDSYKVLGLERKSKIKSILKEV